MDLKDTALKQQKQSTDSQHQTPHTHLIIVCGHAIYHGNIDSDPRKEDNWALKSFQKGTDTKPGEHTNFLHHAFAAVQVLDTSPKDSTLIAFSGGTTDAEYPELSEAATYLTALQDWAKIIGYELPEDKLKRSVIVEDMATDSYQNVLFSVLQFRRRTGHYPTLLTIVTDAFKSERFLDLHGKALKWPEEEIKVLGINPSFSKAELESTTAGERTNGYGPLDNRSLWHRCQAIGEEEGARLG